MKSGRGLQAKGIILRDDLSRPGHQLPQSFGNLRETFTRNPVGLFHHTTVGPRVTPLPSFAPGVGKPPLSQDRLLPCVTNLDVTTSLLTCRNHVHIVHDAVIVAHTALRSHVRRSGLA